MHAVARQVLDEGFALARQIGEARGTADPVEPRQFGSAGGVRSCIHVHGGLTIRRYILLLALVVITIDRATY